MTNAETDWSRLNRVVEQMTTRLDAAQFEEDFQSIGHLAREAFISLGQAVYDRARHPSEDGVTPSATDAKRMLTAYVAAEMSGAVDDEARRLQQPRSFPLMSSSTSAPLIASPDGRVLAMAAFTSVRTAGAATREPLKA